LTKKIQDNYSFKEMDSTIKGLKTLSSIYKVASKVGLKNSVLDEAFNKLVEMEKQSIQLKETPDEFNSLLGEAGWIAYESMNFDIMLKAVELAKNDKNDEAEQILVEYYNENTLRSSLRCLKGIEEYRPRINLTYNALDDYLAQRYYACIPVILMMIDGFVNDFEQKGFFATDVDLSVWDTIAAHSSGLNHLSCIFGKSRKKITSEEIALPYRNGILHGRDLGYGNKTVAAKCWAALFAIGDWARALKDGKKGIDKEFEPPTLKESITSLTESLKMLSENQEQKKAIEEWLPRKIAVGIDFPGNGEAGEYSIDSPEKILVEFFEYMGKNNYGKMAQYVTKICPSVDSIGKVAKEVRTIFRGKKLLNFKISNIRDEAPAISEIDTVINFEIGGKQISHEHTFRLIYQDDKCSTYVRGHNDGAWKILWNFYQIEFLSGD
jgi:hypothetical protein